MPSRRPITSRKKPIIDLDRELDEMYASPITRPNLGFLRVGQFPASKDDPSTAGASSEQPRSLDTPPGHAPGLEALQDVATFDSRSKELASTARASTELASNDAVSTAAASMDVRSGSDAKSLKKEAIAALPSIDAPSIDQRPAGKWKVHHCVTVQDGHSANEQLLYEALWRLARPVGDVRVIQISREEMAAQTRITIRNIKGVLDRLVEKLAVERITEPNSFTRVAATYRIYPYRVILEKRRLAGLEWVTRANGVKFIVRELAMSLMSRSRFGNADVSQPTFGMDLQNQPSPAAVDPTSTDAVTRDLRSMDDRSTPVPGELGLGLRKINPAFDSAAVARLWRECRAKAKDCTAEEVLHFTQLKAKASWEDKSVRNTIGLLLKTVPEFFDPSVLAPFRAEQQERAAEEARLLEENRQYWFAVLEDPASSEADRVLAREFVGRI
jgi:hypothetical protein